MTRTLFNVPGLALALGLALFLFMAAPAPAADIGTVIALTPGVSVLRNGQSAPLEPGSGILVSDSVQTDATGRVKILFTDDSAVSLGPNTSLGMSEYAELESEPVFVAHVSQGLVRVITGKIVEQNPDGFRLSTPEATVGIRGTIVSLRVENGLSTVYVENTLRQVFVNGVNVPGGFKISLPAPGVPRPEPISPQDRRELGRDLALHGGQGVAAAAPEPGMEVRERRQPSLSVAAGPSLGLADTPLTGIGLGTQDLGNSLSDPPAEPPVIPPVTPPVIPPVTPPVIPPVTPPVGPAYVTGTLTPTSITYDPELPLVEGTGSFSFTVDLGSGAVSGATMSNTHTLDGGSMSYTLSNGSGAITGNELTVSGFTGRSTFNGDDSATPAAGNMAGTASQGPSGLTVNGTYGVDLNYSSWPEALVRDEGAFAGQQQ